MVYTTTIITVYFIIIPYRLSGCYESLNAGTASEAMTDFTGGVTEKFDFKSSIPDDLYDVMEHACRGKALMGCSINVSYHLWYNNCSISHSNIYTEDLLIKTTFRT